MTLTELRYIVALAQEGNFSRAAESCSVSQPTLSVAIARLEDELGVQLFERGKGFVSPSAVGARVVEQAQQALREAEKVRQVAMQGRDQLDGPLRLGVIHTIGPYLLPDLVREVIRAVPQMPLMLHENLTVKLLEMLRNGEIDCAILAEPFPDAGLAIAPLYDEPFMAAVPASHPLAAQATVTAEQLKSETMLLLGAGHCFRDHVLEVCPEFARFANHTDGIRKSFEGSSLETIKHMVAAGMGMTLVPRLSVPDLKPVTRRATSRSEAPVRYLPVLDAHGGPPPKRRVVLAWRRSFTRYEAIAALRNAIYACPLSGVTRLS